MNAISLRCRGVSQEAGGGMAAIQDRLVGWGYMGLGPLPAEGARERGVWSWLFTHRRAQNVDGLSGGTGLRPILQGGGEEEVVWLSGSSVKVVSTPQGQGPLSVSATPEPFLVSGS